MATRQGDVALLNDPVAQTLQPHVFGWATPQLDGALRCGPAAPLCQEKR
jgi:hypothetical protein